MLARLQVGHRRARSPYPLLVCLAVLVACSESRSRNTDPIDVLANAPQVDAADLKARLDSASDLLRTDVDVQTHGRFNVPTFLWSSREGGKQGLEALRAAKGGASSAGDAPRETHEEAARAHLATYATLYGLSAEDLANAKVVHTHDIGRGPIIVQFQQVVDGVEVFREQARLVMARDHQLIALSGHIASAPETKFKDGKSFRLDGRDAIAAAYTDLSGQALTAGELEQQPLGEGHYLHFAPRGAASGRPGAMTQPARAKQVWFHQPERLIPAWYVEVDAALPEGGSDAFSYVISAVDGAVLTRHNLTADASNVFTYRVWASAPTDVNNPAFPYDEPIGDLYAPHPTGVPDGLQPTLVAQADVTLASSPYPYIAGAWLPTDATETNGNNVDAYMDLGLPDGFSPDAGDFRADVTAPNQFLRTYNAALPLATNQQKAALTQMFYNVNFFHDWYYGSGFDEAAGNAQANNYGRGGLQNDSIKAEGQDSSGRNNATMQTPADGARPRMQMYVFDALADRHLEVTPGSLDYATGVPSGWGISSHDVTAELVWINDGVGSSVYPPATTTTTTIHDGCNPGAWAGVAGKIAFVDRGGAAPAGSNCGFSDKAYNAQQAGAIGVIIASTTANNAAVAGNMAATQPLQTITIPAYQLSTPDGNALRALLQAGTVTVRMLRPPVGVEKDGTIDSQIMAHEWGHYISNRLVSNANGLNTNMARGLGEGWADVHALLMTVKQDDRAVSYNATYGGVYPLSAFLSVGGANGPGGNQGLYFGIRRMPYSTDLTKNNMTYKNVQDSAAIPTGVPFAFWPAPGTPSASGGNSETHNSGEVWATMVWECYAALLRDTTGASPRMSFTQARDLMKDYLVAAYKATPPQPTLLEARDALLSVVYGTSSIDYGLFAAAFAKRGAGVGAIAPDRYSTTNNGVTESFVTGAQLNAVSATLNDAVTACDQDGVLDSGETGQLLITLRNDSPLTLTSTTATITAVGPNSGNVTFPAGNTITFGSTQPRESITGSVNVALAASVTGVQTVDFQIVYGDTALTPATYTVNVTRRANYDDVLGQSFVDTVESGQPQFAALSLANNTVGGAPWIRNEISATDHNYKAVDPNAEADLALISPALAVSPSGSFVVSFKHRYSFEFSGTSLFDGAVVELSSDNGNTWKDIGSVATGGQLYTGALFGGTALGTRPAFAAVSPGYPALVTTTIDLGTAYAGQTVRVRFRLASDSGGRGTGWEVDDISFQGIANLPFPALLANKCAANQTNRRPVAVVSTIAAQPERTAVSLSGSGSTDADNDTLTYQWSQVSGPTVTLTGANTVSVGFTTPDVPSAGGSVVLALVVSDGTAFSAGVTRTVTITNVDRPPVSVAGANQSAAERTLVQLNGSGSDPDGDLVTFAWSQTGGTAVVLTGATTATPTFAAPEVGTAGATLTFQLAVTANAVTTNSTTQVTVTNANRSPTASAGAAQQVNERALAQLQGAANDADGDTLTFAWTQVSPATPAVTLSSAAALSPTFTAPEVTADTDFTFQLSVSDGIAPPVLSTVGVKVLQVNRPPVALATAPSVASARTAVMLNGSTSIDPDGQTLTYAWVAVSTLPANATLTNATAAIATFNTGDVGADTPVTLRLTVSDGTLTADTTVTVTVTGNNRAPVAVLTAPAAANARTAVMLDGSGSSDPDADALTFIWTQTAGPGVALSTPTTAQPTFTAPDVSADTTLTFSLRVSDGARVSPPATASVVVHKANRPPVAHAGPGQTVDERATVKLFGSASSDPDGDGITFTWKQTSPAEPLATLDDTHAATPSFTAPEVDADTDFVFSLVVNDGSVDSESASATVKVKNANRGPIARTGEDRTVAGGAEVTLDGTGSSDPDGEALTFTWAQISGPSVTLRDETTATPSFTAPKPEVTTVLVFELTATDALGASSTAKQLVTVEGKGGGCGCSSADPGSVLMLFAAAGLFWRRRRR